MDAYIDIAGQQTGGFWCHGMRQSSPPNAFSSAPSRLGWTTPGQVKNVALRCVVLTAEPVPTITRCVRILPLYLYCGGILRRSRAFWNPLKHQSSCLFATYSGRLFSLHVQIEQNMPCICFHRFHCCMGCFSAAVDAERTLAFVAPSAAIARVSDGFYPVIGRPVSGALILFVSVFLHSRVFSCEQGRCYYRPPLDTRLPAPFTRHFWNTVR